MALNTCHYVWACMEIVKLKTKQKRIWNFNERICIRRIEKWGSTRQAHSKILNWKWSPTSIRRTADSKPLYDWSFFLAFSSVFCSMFHSNLIKWKQVFVCWNAWPKRMASSPKSWNSIELDTAAYGWTLLKTIGIETKLYEMKWKKKPETETEINSRISIYAWPFKPCKSIESEVK